MFIESSRRIEIINRAFENNNHGDHDYSYAYRLARRWSIVTLRKAGDRVQFERILFSGSVWTGSRFVNDDMDLKSFPLTFCGKR
jgi:hypothetical protein